MAPGGTLTAMSGSQVAVVSPPTLVAVTTPWGVPLSVTDGAKPKVAWPVAWLSSAML